MVHYSVGPNLGSSPNSEGCLADGVLCDEGRCDLGDNVCPSKTRLSTTCGFRGLVSQACSAVPQRKPGFPTKAGLLNA